MCAPRRRLTDLPTPTEWDGDYNGYSIGFAPAGATIQQNTADVFNTSDPQRLSWHTSGGSGALPTQVFDGWRAGANIGISSGWNRFVFVGRGATTLPPTGVTTTSATLNGTANPQGLATTAWFQWGTDPALSGATSTTAVSVGSGTSDVAISNTLTGLTSNTTYYFRAVMNNSSGTLPGGILSFVTGPEIAVEQPAGTNLVDAAATVDFLDALIASPSQPKTFTIKNNGSLNLTGLSVSVDGLNAGDFAVSALGSTTLAPGGSTTFTVTVTPSALGARSAALHIASNDANENPFDINLAANGVEVLTIIGGSDLLTPPDVVQLQTWLGEGTLTLTKVFAAAPGDGKTATNFHAAVNGIGRTFTVIELPAQGAYGRKVIGGYNPQSWSSINNYNYTYDDTQRTAFLFNLTTGLLQRQKLNSNPNGGIGQYQTYNNSSYGPTFGGGHDLYVDNSLRSGYTNNYSYGPNVGYYSSAIADGGQGSGLTYARMEVFTISVAPPAPEIAVEQPTSTNIADGGTKDFGTVNVGSNTSLTFTIKNTGSANLTGLTITKDGTNQSDFTVTANPTAPVSGPSGTTTFTVQFAPSGGGTRTAAIHIANNDSNENPFDINLTGTGFQTTYVWSGGGATNNWSEGANWVGGGAPTNDGTKDIVFGASSRYTSLVDAPWAVNSIVFGSGRTSDYTLLGSDLTVGAGGIEARNAAGRGATITNVMTLAASQTWRQFATTNFLSFNGAVALGGQTLSVTSEYPGTGGAGVRLGGNITGTGNLILNPGTNIYVEGSHSYIGTLTCTSGGGNVHVSSPDAFPGVVTNHNNSIIFNSGHTNNRTISGFGSIMYNSDQNYTITSSNNYTGRTELGYQGTPQITLASNTPFGSGYVLAWYRGAGISGDSARTFPNQLAFGHDADKAFTFGGSFPLTFTGGAMLAYTARAVVTAPSLAIQGVVSTWFGTSDLVKEGPGTLVLSGATPNTYTGNTTVKAGTLSLSKSPGSAAIATGVLSVEPTASVSWAASDQIANGVNVVMSGGELNLGGRSETMGTLDLDGVAELDFGTVAGSAAVAFSSSSALNWTGATLTVSGFVPGTTMLRFGTNATGLSPAQLAAVQFTGFTAGAQINSAGYVTPPGFTSPTFAGYSFSTAYQTAATVSFAKLLTMAADADGDALTITAAGPSVNGGTVVMQANSLLYTPPNGFSAIDTFQVTITDADGLWVIGTVTATVQTSNSSGGASSNTPVLTGLSGGRMGIDFYGIPGRPYEVQRSTNLTTWDVLTTVTAAPNGAVTFIDESPPPGSAFYRLRKP